MEETKTHQEKVGDSLQPVISTRTPDGIFC